MAITIDEAMARLEAAGDERLRQLNAQKGAGDNQYGVRLGPLRAFARELKTNHALGLALWATGNTDARFLATMVLDPAQLSEDAFEAMLRPLTYVALIDELTSELTARSPAADALRERWMASPDDLVARAGWNLWVARVLAGKTRDLDVPAVIATIEAELVAATPHKQWAMNRCLVEIAVRLPEFRETCVAIGERLGVYADQKVAKGCTSAYAPGWIAAVVAKRK